MSDKQVYEIIYENEKVADQILQNKALIIDYDRKRQGNREALRELRKSTEKNVWMTIGSMLIEMERQKAIDVITDEQTKIDKEIDKLRDEQLVLVKKHKDLEMDKMPSGFDLKPLSKNEINALKSNLKL
ncbi:hypothetical protein PVAND_005030 [Polypedilum vanderplanki]|uniref:P53 and DNA damage-regulated protein 1 n=1 Tax=Polypedilum vanderplanki TaxID=319348 RepID=A0A9J6BZC4_POLVA|nr:hypothetical protein PVAND_005030 [Polypedilum vanderplanki]